MRVFLSAVRTQRILPVLRADDPEAAFARVEQLVRAGCRVVELTTTIPSWEQAVERAVGSFAGDGVFVGVGTVTTADQATRAIGLGATFLVSPFAAGDVRAAAGAADVPFLEGALTPSELAEAAKHGPVKLFPAHVGGPTYLKSVRTILGGADIIPTGGIGLADVDAYLAAGAVAVGLGSGFPSEPDELAGLFARYAG